MKKVLFLAFLMLGSVVVFCNDTDSDQNQAAISRFFWFGKGCDTPVVGLSIVKKDLTTNIEHESHTKAVKIKHEITLPEPNDLRLTAYRGKNNTLILKGYIPKCWSIYGNNPRFEFKICIQCDQLSNWDPYQIALQFTYRNSLIKLGCDPSFLGCLRLTSLVGQAYDQTYEVKSSISKDKINQTHLMQQDIERHYFNGQDWESKVYTVKLETTHDDDNLITKFLLSDKNFSKEFGYIKIANPDAIANDLQCTMYLASTTSGETIEAQLLVS